MAEDIDSTANELQTGETSVTRRTRGRSGTTPRAKAAKPAAVRPAKIRVARASASPSQPRSAANQPSRGTKSPLRSLATIALVGGLVATVALPAYGAWRPTEAAVTLQQAAADDAQSLVIASDANSAELTRDSYSATTPEEIQKKKDEEAAAAEAAARARLVTTASSSIPVNINLVSPGSGEVRWPILNFTLGRGLWDSGYHQGVDLLAPAMTPIYATAAGVVRISSEGYGGYGVAVSIDHVIGGQQVNSLYGHMTYGTRQVQVGDTVAAGQLIGFVGSTGSSTANHVHFEIHINGGVVDPWAWLQANAG